MTQNISKKLNFLQLTDLSLKTLKTDKQSGPDGLSNLTFRELSHELFSPLCSLFNKSLSLGNFPSPYKDANVTPVHKEGDLSLVSNYRPISLLNYVAKLFEKTCL